MKRLYICSFMVLLFLCGCMTVNDNDDSINQDTINVEETKENAGVVDVPQNEIIEVVSSVTDKIIVIDAGHGISSYNKQEPIAPNSSKTKNAFVSGTRGSNQTEEELNLSVALKLETALKNKGAIVHMTRTEHKCDMTNVDRAVFANELNADISVKIHADGNNNSSVRGVSVLVPGVQYIKDEDVIEKSRELGEFIIEDFIKETNADNRGISVRNDLTGFNWTKVPIVLVEIGFMTNPEEDKLLETDEYQEKIVNGIVSGIEKYFNNIDGGNYE